MHSISRYNQLSEMVDDSHNSVDTGSKSLLEWSVNLGEMVVDISVVNEGWVLVLGERNLFCFNTKGKMRFMKHMDYSPICFNVYLKGLL